MDGFVLPAAINKAIYVSVSKNADNNIHLYSVDFKEVNEVAVSDIRPINSGSTCILGVAHQSIKGGYVELAVYI